MSFTRSFDVEKWGNVHDTHVYHKGEHPLGVMKVDVTAYVRTFRMSESNFKSLSNDFVQKVEAMLSIWLYRYAKRGHVAISDTLEITIDRDTHTVYVWYDAYDVPPEWACVVTSKVTRDLKERQESSAGMEEALKNLSTHIDRLSGEREGMRTH